MDSSQSKSSLPNLDKSQVAPSLFRSTSEKLNPSSEIQKLYEVRKIQTSYSLRIPICSPWNLRTLSFSLIIALSLSHHKLTLLSWEIQIKHLRAKKFGLWDPDTSSEIQHHLDTIYNLIPIFIPTNQFQSENPCYTLNAQEYKGMPPPHNTMDSFQRNCVMQSLLCGKRLIVP